MCGIDTAESRQRQGAAGPRVASIRLFGGTGGTAAMSLQPVADRTLRRTNRILFTFVYGILAVLILGSIGLAVGYARAESRADSFAAAQACTAAGGKGCARQVQEQSIQLVNAGETSGRSSTYWLEITGNSVPDQVVDLACTNSSSFFLTAQGNGQLTAEVWDGRVINVTYNGAQSCEVGNTPTTQATLWLLGLGIFGSLSVGWLALIARGRFATSKRSRILTGAAVAPIYLNIVIFPVLIGVLGSRSLWPYLPAYAIGLALETPFVIRNALRHNDPHAKSAAYRTPRYAPISTSNTMSAARTRHRGRITLHILIGLCLLATALTLAAYIPAQSNAFAYENAPTCQGTATSGCVANVTATLVDSGTYQTDSGDVNWIEISGPGISDLQFTLSGDNAYGLDMLQPGAKLTALVWKDKVVEVEYQGSTSPGPTTPAQTAADFLAAVYACAGLALFLILLRLAVLRKERTALSRLYGISAIALLLGGIFAFIPLTAENRPVWWAFPLTFGISVLVVTPIYTLTAAAARRKARRRAGTLPA